MSFFAKWSLANAFGLSIGFLTILQVGMLLQFGFDLDAHWKPSSLGQGVWLGYRFVGLLLGGTIFAATQAVVLRPYLKHVFQWVIAGALGFGCVIAIMWPLWSAGLWGYIPGPIEPILITVGGGSMMGLLQWSVLRRNSIHATKWLLLWLAGLLASIPVTFVVFFFVMGILKIELGWPIEVALSGFLVGGVPAAISAKAIHATLLSRD